MAKGEIIEWWILILYKDEKPLIRRGRVDSLNIYEVKEHELELLEKGAAGTL